MRYINFTMRFLSFLGAWQNFGENLPWFKAPHPAGYGILAPLQHSIVMLFLPLSLSRFFVCSFVYLVGCFFPVPTQSFLNLHPHVIDSLQEYTDLWIC